MASLKKLRAKPCKALRIALGEAPGKDSVVDNRAAIVRLLAGRSLDARHGGDHVEELRFRVQHGAFVAVETVPLGLDRPLHHREFARRKADTHRGRPQPPAGQAERHSRIGALERVACVEAMSDRVGDRHGRPLPVALCAS